MCVPLPSAIGDAVVFGDFTDDSSIKALSEISSARVVVVEVVVVLLGFFTVVSSMFFGIAEFDTIVFDVVLSACSRLASRFLLPLVSVAVLTMGLEQTACFSQPQEKSAHPHVPLSL